MHQPRNTRSFIARALALGIACCIMLFLVQIVVHQHAAGQNEAACRVCHAAHIGSGPAINALILATPLLTSGVVREAVLLFHKELFGHDSPSRAPPVA
jgi:hypothetical protein